jgi:hypothetical protein
MSFPEQFPRSIYASLYNSSRKVRRFFIFSVKEAVVEKEAAELGFLMLMKFLATILPTGSVVAVKVQLSVWPEMVSFVAEGSPIVWILVA